MHEKTKPPISAIVASADEGKILGDCLASLNFCDEIIVINMESSDTTEDVAKNFGAKIVRHKRVDVVEKVRAFGAEHARHDWVLFLDPDERISKELAKDLEEQVLNDNGRQAIIKAPILYYFKQKPLRGTVWGGEKWRPLLVHKDRAALPALVHAGYAAKSGYSVKTIEWRGANVIHHFWASSWRELFEKHRRYLKHEGETRYYKGERFNWLYFLRRTVGSFFSSFFAKKGYQDGPLGLTLSLFWMWYTAASLLALRRYRELRNTKITS